jgi:hypothetical protein
MEGRMISYDGWDREYKQNAGAYIELFDQFMNQTNYENLLFDENKTVRLVDPNSFHNVPLDRMNNLLFFGRYMDTLTSIRERLSFEELTEDQKYRLGRGYLY